ncbi:MAG: hypothetical protein ACXVC6_13860 [Bacteroidia bacterium]
MIDWSCKLGNFHMPREGLSNGVGALFLPWLLQKKATCESPTSPYRDLTMKWNSRKGGGTPKYISNK